MCVCLNNLNRTRNAEYHTVNNASEKLPASHSSSIYMSLSPLHPLLNPLHFSLFIIFPFPFSFLTSTPFLSSSVSSTYSHSSSCLHFPSSPLSYFSFVPPTLSSPLLLLFLSHLSRLPPPRPILVPTSLHPVSFWLLALKVNKT